MTFLPYVVRADYRGGFRIHLTFNDLTERTVDFRAWLEGPVFEALKDPVIFPRILCRRRHRRVAERGRYRARDSLRGCDLEATRDGEDARQASKGARPEETVKVLKVSRKT